MDNEGLREALSRIDAAGRDKLRRLLYADQSDRDRIAKALLRRQTPEATDLADLLDHLSIDDEARRRVVRLLGEIEAERT